MENNDEFLFEEKKGEEKLLDFEFDEALEKQIKGPSDNASSDEEVLKLVDIVEMGDMVGDLESDEIATLLAEETVENQVEVDEGSDLVSDEVFQGLEPGLDSVPEGLESSQKADIDLEILERDLEAVSEAELLGNEVESEAPQEDAEQVVLEGASLETPTEVPYEVVEGVPDTSEEQLESEKISLSHAAEKLIEVFEERVESILTEVVQDVVERTVKKTMAGVAEKVITEAIDALKESLESPQDTEVGQKEMF